MFWLNNKKTIFLEYVLLSGGMHSIVSRFLGEISKIDVLFRAMLYYFAIFLTSVEGIGSFSLSLKLKIGSQYSIPYLS